MLSTALCGLFPHPPPPLFQADYIESEPPIVIGLVNRLWMNITCSIKQYLTNSTSYQVNNRMQSWCASTQGLIPTLILNTQPWEMGCIYWTRKAHPKPEVLARW